MVSCPVGQGSWSSLQNISLLVLFQGASFALWSQSVKWLHLWRGGDCLQHGGHVHWEAVPIAEGGWFRQQALVCRLPTTGDMSSCNGQQELLRKAQDTTRLEFGGVQFSRICEVRHQENLSNVLFYIQDADQRLRNRLSGMVQFVPKDMEEERVRHHSEDPVSVLGPCFRGSDGDRRGGGGQRGRCKGSASRAARRPGVHVTQRGLGGSVAGGGR